MKIVIAFVKITFKITLFTQKQPMSEIYLLFIQKPWIKGYEESY